MRLVFFYNYNNLKTNDPRRVTSLLYHPPVDEFSVCTTKLGPNEKSGKFGAVNGPSILLVAAGSGTLQYSDDPSEAVTPLSGNTGTLETGYVLYVSDQTTISFTAGGEGLLVFRAYCSPLMRF